MLQRALSRESTLAATQLSDVAAVAAPSADFRPARPPQPNSIAATVECVGAERLVELQSEWQDLVGRADIANVFMNPLLVAIAAQCFRRDRCRVLLAWQDSGARRRLVGVWAFAVRRLPQSMLPVRMLAAPASAHAYLATPVVDRSALDAVLDAMLAHVADDPSLPNIVTLEAIAADSATMQALSRVLAKRDGSSCVLGRFARPKLASDLDGKRYLERALSSSTRKKLRQHRRRLAEKGALEFRVLTAPDAVGDAFEAFLQLEASGWKGRQGTALLNDNADAAFARGMIAALARAGDAAIHALYLDGQPVSMQVVLRAGPAAFTWKTAYDETWHDVSPGMLLLEDYTAALLADESIAFVDSCAHDDSGFMASWSERQPMIRLWIDARCGRTLSFPILAQLQKTYLAARNVAKTIYLARPRRRSR